MASINALVFSSKGRTYVGRIWVLEWPTWATVIGVYSISAGKDSQSRPVQMLLLAASPLCALLGGYLRQAQKGMVARRFAG